MKTKVYSKKLTLSLCIASLLSSSPLWAKDIKISGDLMLDHDSFESGFMEDSDKSQSLSEVRRARLTFKTKYKDDWRVKLKVNFSTDSAEIKDAYIRYKGFDWADVTIGMQKEGFGLERRAHSRDALLIERSLMTTALAPGRSLGVSLANGANAYNWQIGYYQPDDGDGTNALTGRAAWLPWRHGNELVHVGFAFSERDLNGSQYRINERLEVHTADKVFEGKKLNADSESLQGIELLWQQAGFTTFAEWQQSQITDVNNIEYDYQGGYVQLSYQFSGDNRAYKNGKLGAVTTPGWEISSRYSQFELIEEQRDAKIYTIGVNYTVDENLKFMTDVVMADQYEVSKETDSSLALSFRAQYVF